MPNAPFRKILVVFALAAGVFIVLSAMALSGTAYAYRNKFYPGVKVGSTDIGGLSRSAGEAKVRSVADGYLAETVTVAIPDVQQPRNESTGRYPEVEVATTSKELGLAFVTDAALEEAWGTGHRYGFDWFASALGSIFAGAPEPLRYSVDQSAVSMFVSMKVAEKVALPQPAKIVVDGDSVSILEGRQGVEILESELAQKVASALVNVTDGSPVYLRADVKTTDSSITKASLQPVADQLDRLGNSTVTMTAEGVSLKPNRAELLSWYITVQDENGAVSIALQPEKVGAYIKAKAGSKLDQAKSEDAAIKALAAAVSSESTPKVSVALVAKPKVEVKPGEYTLGDYPGKYVQVSLKDQRMYLVNGTTLEKTFIISSGKWATPTPKGTFTLNGHIRRAWSYSFKLWMPYWIGFIGTEYGFHELPEWPNGAKEGQSHLGTPVSHGCVRLGVGDAAYVYDWVVDGTPLIIR